MTARFPATPVLRLPENKSGKDYALGDIHGCFTQVLRAMDKVNFDQSRDRIISVGDMIDRGPDSHRTARFLASDFVFAVRGNHEDMLLEIYEDGEPHPAVLEMMHSRNGFDWWRGASEDTRRAVLDAIAPLPIAIEVATHRGTVGFIHAEVPLGMDWTTFTKRLEAGDEDVAQSALWGRRRISRGDSSGVEGIGRVFVGHTPVSRPTRLGNVYAVDTGAVFGCLEVADGSLTFADITTSTLAFGPMDDPDENLVRVLQQAERERRPFSLLATLR